jgi:hypothetical protein
MAVNTVLPQYRILQATSIGESFDIISSVRKKVTDIELLLPERVHTRKNNRHHDRTSITFKRSGIPFYMQDASVYGPYPCVKR